MEDWEELGDGEQDPATDYYALLNVPRDVLAPPLPPPLLSQPRMMLIEIARLRSVRSAAPTTPSRSASIPTNSPPIAKSAPRPISTMCWSRTRR